MAREVNRPMTSAERQARRREQFRQMREALDAFQQAKTLREAKAIAAGAFPNPGPGTSQPAPKTSRKPPSV